MNGRVSVPDGKETPSTIQARPKKHLEAKADLQAQGVVPNSLDPSNFYGLYEKGIKQANP